MDRLQTTTSRGHATLGVLSLLAALGACGEPTGPRAELRLTLLDDAGRSAGRHQVLIAQPDGVVDTTGTGREGVLTFRVRSAGTHQIRVVPSHGFVGSLPGLRHELQLDATASTQLRVKLQRAGSEPYVWWIEDCRGFGCG